CFFKRLLRRKQHAPIKRIGTINRLQLHQRLPTRCILIGAPRLIYFGAPRHGTHFGGGSHLCVAGKPGAFFRARLAMDETDAYITAKNVLPALGKAACQCRRDGADTCNRRNPKRKTGDENAKPSDAAAQFAPRKPGGKRKGGRLV